MVVVVVLVVSGDKHAPSMQAPPVIIITDAGFEAAAFDPQY